MKMNKGEINFVFTFFLICSWFSLFVVSLGWPKGFARVCNRFPLGFCWCSEGFKNYKDKYDEVDKSIVSKQKKSEKTDNSISEKLQMGKVFKVQLATSSSNIPMEIVRTKFLLVKN